MAGIIFPTTVARTAPEQSLVSLFLNKFSDIVPHPSEAIQLSLSVSSLFRILGCHFRRVIKPRMHHITGWGDVENYWQILVGLILKK